MFEQSVRRIVEQVRMECVDDAGRIQDLPVTLVYSTDDPLAVRATFHTARQDVSWVFARDLLIRGGQEMAGEGDVSCWPSFDMTGQPVVILELDAFGISMVSQVSRRDVDRFIGRSLALVPQGAEIDAADLDALIDRLLLAS